jgi:hypothetical protein
VVLGCFDIVVASGISGQLLTKDFTPTRKTITDEAQTTEGTELMSTEVNPKEYLMSMQIGPDGAVQVAPHVADSFRTAASRLKMHGLKFKTRMVAPGSPSDQTGTGGMIITRVK